MSTDESATAGSVETHWPGLATTSLGSLLAAVGMSESVERMTNRRVALSWAGDRFRLRSDLDADGIIRELLVRHSPVPLVAPWNGSDQGGFLTGAETRASGLLLTIETSDDPRFSGYAEVISKTRNIVSQPRWQAALKANQKAEMVGMLRNELPDSALDFLDTAVALTSADQAEFPPILGTGGNIGRLDLVANYMEHLGRIITGPAGKGQSSESWLRQTLVGTPAPGVVGSLGQFDPQSTGGANLGRADAGQKLANPWSYVLTLEGSLIFGSTITRRFGSQRAKASAPFTVNSSAAGYPSALSAEKSKGELWFPLWDQFISLDDLRSLMAEGRATWNGGQARSGVDLLRAVRTLGIDRGVSRFERFGFLERNGQSPAAVSLGQVDVRSRPAVSLTNELDSWVNRVERIGDNKKPASVKTAARRLDLILYKAADNPTAANLRRLLNYASAVESVLGRSSQFVKDNKLKPIPVLSSDWLTAIDDGSREFRIARALAAGADQPTKHVVDKQDQQNLNIASYLRPISGGRPEWASYRIGGPLVPGLHRRPAVDVLADLALARNRSAPSATSRSSGDRTLNGISPQFSLVTRRDSKVVSRTLRSSLLPSLADIESVAAGDVDLELLREHLIACLLIAAPQRSSTHAVENAPADDFSTAPQPLLRLLAPWFGREPLDVATRRRAKDAGIARLVPSVPPNWIPRLVSGNPAHARSVAREAVWRYAAAGFRTTVDPDQVALASRPELVVAALLIPAAPRTLSSLVTNQTYVKGGSA